jgi:hypothetical protein
VTFSTPTGFFNSYFQQLRRSHQLASGLKTAALGDCGGVYLFTAESSASDFLKEHLPFAHHTSPDRGYCGETA